MSAFVVRKSHYRHVFATPGKGEENFMDLRLSSATGDQTYIKSNGVYFAVAVQGGGGPFTVIPLNKPGRYNSPKVFNGHSGAVLDFDFHSFDESLIASCSDDQFVKLWKIPDGGLTDNITAPLVDMKGHNRRVTLLKFHPTADNVLASVSKDNEIKLWDVSTGTQILSNMESKDLVQDIVWDYTGKHYTTATKDKNVSIYDARTTGVVHSMQAHEGSKAVKLAYLGDTGNFLSVGFTRQSGRQFKIWDPRNLEKALHTENIDTASGAIIPFYDPDTQLLYLAGKGDGNVRYYELTPTAKPYQFPINAFKSNVPAKGMAWIPKRKLNIMKCETARLLKLTTNSMEPISFTVPRKSETFQDDIFPDTDAGVAACTAAEWLAGTDRPPVKVCLDPAKGGATTADAGTTSAPIKAPTPTPTPAAAERIDTTTGVSAVKAANEGRPTSSPAAFTFAPEKSAAVLTGELATANARIAHLEARLKAAGLSTD